MNDDIAIDIEDIYWAFWQKCYAYKFDENNFVLVEVCLNETMQKIARVRYYDKPHITQKPIIERIILVNEFTDMKEAVKFAIEKSYSDYLFDEAKKLSSRG